MKLIHPMAALLALCAPALTPLFAQTQPRIIASATQAVVSTDAGKVQGFIHLGTYVFRGIPYAQAARFEAPVKPEPWQGVRQTLIFGPECPHIRMAPMTQQGDFIMERRIWPMSEACQNLNVWTPGINDGKKRPVMVWLHGGGYSEGSAIEQRIYEGENLSKKGDVVVISINHRLNVLGFLDLSAYGDKFRDSGNAGIADLVAALDWVRRNAASFGGDPANVTIFGESGGGGKVVTLLGTPAAKGLFHKAIVQSGTTERAGVFQFDQPLARRAAELLLEQLGLKADQIGLLQQMPYDKLVAAADQAMEKAAIDSGMSFHRSSGMWSPVAGTAFLPRKPFVGSAPEESANVPILVGSTLNETMQGINPKLKDSNSWSEAETMAYLRGLYGEKTDAVVAAYRKAYPKLPINQWVIVDALFRPRALDVLRLKAAQGKAPAYNYLFAWQSPVLDYAVRSAHGMEISFAFNNAVEAEQMTGAGPDALALTAQMSQAWINFARSGNPNHAGLPNWQPYTAQKPVTMIFDSPSHASEGHDAGLMELIRIK